MNKRNTLLLRGCAVRSRPTTRRLSSALLALCAFALSGTNAAATQTASLAHKTEGARVSHVLGFAHVGAHYAHLDNVDSLNEGAQIIEEMGGSIMKIFMGHKFERNHYRWNITWPDPRPKTLLELAQSTPFDTLFRRPGIRTYLIDATSFAVGTGRVKWTNGLSTEESETVYDEMYGFVVHLRENYPDKTFIIQNWEGDNAFPRGLSYDTDSNNDGNLDSGGPRGRAEQGMIDWLNIRGTAVAQAKADTNKSTAEVWYAIEFNWLPLYPISRPHFIIETVIPHTSADLYSLSSWSTGKNNGQEDRIRDYMMYMEKLCPDSEAFGSKNVMIGEFGSAESEHKITPDDSMSPSAAEFEQFRIHRQVTGRQLEQFLHWGVPYIAQWSIYDNELRRKWAVLNEEGQVVNNQGVKGFYAIRPDGSKAMTYDLFKAVLKEDLEKYRNVFEIENQRMISEVYRVIDVTDPDASGGAYNWIVAPSIGSDTIYEMFVQQPGTYQIKVGFKTTPDAGAFIIRHKGNNIGSSVDTFGGGEVFTSAVLTGTVTLSRADVDKAQQFTVRSSGKNGASAGTHLRIDYIKLIPQE